MFLFLLFFFSLFFLFFDVFSFCFFVCFFMICVIFCGSESFHGIFFFDSVSFLLVLLSFLVLVFCFFSSLCDKFLDLYSFGFFYVTFYFFFCLSVFFVLMYMFFILCLSLFLFLCFFLLNWGYSFERVQASFYMVFYTLVVSFPFFVFLLLSYFSFKSGNFFCLGGGLSYWWFFTFLVFLVKLPVYGVHLWLPKAHVEAPVSGSMVLAGVLLKLGGYGLYRFSFFFSDILVGFFLCFFYWFGWWCMQVFLVSASSWF